MTTQRYDVPSDQIENCYVGIIALDLDRIWNRHWNMEKVIIFQTVILQRTSQVSSSRNIHDRIDSHINLLNKGAYDELAQYSYRAA